MTFTVTKLDIHAGRRDSWCDCPIARCVKRTTKSKYVECDSDGIRFGPHYFEAVHRATPSECLTFMRAFDAGQPVQPFTFELP